MKNRKHRGSSKKSIIQGPESSQYNKYQRLYEIKNVSSVSLQPVSIDRVKDIIKTLNTCADGDEPVKLTKMNEDNFSRLIFQNFNQSLVNGEFPHSSKHTEVIPIFKNKEKRDKSINRTCKCFTSNLQSK